MQADSGMAIWFAPGTRRAQAQVAACGFRPCAFLPRRAWGSVEEAGVALVRRSSSKSMLAVPGSSGGAEGVSADIALKHHCIRIRRLKNELGGEKPLPLSHAIGVALRCKEGVRSI